MMSFCTLSESNVFPDAVELAELAERAELAELAELAEDCSAAAPALY